jgi:putative hydrolase of HD superfamily
MPLLSLLDHVNDLKRLPRMGWLLAGINPAESVADHGFATALLALALAEEVNRDLPAAQLHEPLDVGRVLQIALVHDLAESIVTDLPHRATALLSATVKHNAERTALEQIIQPHSAAPIWRALWEEYAENRSPEARLVRDADKLELAHQALRYTQAGRRGLAEFLTPRPYHYAQSEALFTEIAHAYRATTSPHSSP